MNKELKDFIRAKCIEANPSIKDCELSENDFIEKFASIEHERWSKWQKYLHSKLTKQIITSPNSHGVWEDIETGNFVLHRDWVERWNKQIETPYSELSEKEKESDREQVYPYIQEFVKTIGRDIRLADVLLSFGKLESITVECIYDLSYRHWNLLKDNLDDQTPKTIEFIYNLIKQQ